MGLADKAIQSLRSIVGYDRDEKDQAESPSSDAQRYAPSSTYAIWGREDVGGLLSVSQNLTDRYADYEAMSDYPDIKCFAGDMKVFVVGENRIITPTDIKKIAVDGAGAEILAFDKKKKRIITVAAQNPRLSGRNAIILKIKLSNGSYLRVTPEHKILTVEDGYKEAKTIRKGEFLVGSRSGFDLESKSMLTVAQPGGVWVTEDPKADGVEDVYDITTETHNLLVNGVICHNSAYHYFANDATQPNLDNGRVVWTHSPDAAIVDAADTLIKRRLRLEDDLFPIAYNLALYGNCLPGSSRVWLEDSVEPISNIVPGDRVVLYSGGEATTAPVLAVHNNGTKTVFRLRTSHREILATADHPFLVDEGGEPTWKNLDQLKRGDSIYVCTQSPPNGEPFPLAELIPEVSETAFVNLTEIGRQELDSVRDNWIAGGRRGELLRSHNLPFVWGRIRNGDYGVRLGVLRSLFEDIGLDLEEDHWTPSGGRGGHGVSDLTLPETITPDFCRLYGYYIADGWITEHVSRKSVDACCGNKPEHAEYYLGIAKSLAPRSYLTEDDGTYILHIGSTPMVELFKKLGWKNGAAIKRIPGWLWGLPVEHREAFLQGIADGDGHTTKTPNDKYTRTSIELCNHDLVEDIKTLVDGLGYRCGNIRYRKRTGISSYNKLGAPIYAGESWTITYFHVRLPQPFTVERIRSIEEEGEEEVFDLTIDHEEHNFVADGVVVHNCFEEVLVNNSGVVGLNSLATPTVRRVEAMNGSLIGFVQDVTGRFTADQSELRRMLAGSLEIPKHVALLEDWQMIHFRNRATTRRSPYGMCIPADGLVWTTEGPKPIIDVKIGERVYCRDASNNLVTTSVISNVSNGAKPTYELKTRSRTVRATDNHPFLLETSEGQTWTPLASLKIGDKISVISPTDSDRIIGERVLSITRDKTEEVFDIGVEHAEHNFICNGVVAHNSVAEGARWIWKRLVMLEDAVMIYKLCLRGDSQIWTPDGHKAIKDLNEGDEVYSYTTDRKLKKTKVVYKKHNGQDKIYRVFSDHREIFANKTHPVLVETIIGQGSGKPKIRRLDYVEVQNLKPGIHRLVTPKKNADDWEEIELKKPELHSKARLISDELFSTSSNMSAISRENGAPYQRAKDFFAGNQEIKTSTAVALLEKTDYTEDDLEVEEHWGGAHGRVVRGVTLPDYVDEDFSQWWGFMLGDGFITTRNQTDGVVTTNEVGFALGDKEHFNERYKSLFEKYVPAVKHVNDTGARLGAYSFISCKFAEFMLLNGFIPGAHNKRLPEWVFRARPEIKLAMIRGLAEADAHIKPRNVSKIRGRIRYEVARFEMCNRELLQDVRELAMQLGIVVSFVGSRTRKGGRTIKGSTQPLKETTSYLLDVYLGKPQPETEMLRGVEEIETDDIWDIGVEAEEHNFIADGVSVHNTRAPARYAFYVDVTDVPSNRVESYLTRAKRDLKKKKMVNPNNNFLDMRYNPLSSDEDFFIAVRDGKALSRVEVLSGPDYQSVDDVQYFQRKLHGALMVPRQYLGQDDAGPNRGLLSNEDVRASRVTLQLQRELKNGIEQLIRTDFAARGFPNPWQLDFDVMMTIPSNIYELAAMEVKNARADFAARVHPDMSRQWVLKNVYHLSDEEIVKIDEQRQKEAELMNEMGMDPSFGQFTGGKPPTPEEQMQMQMQAGGDPAGAPGDLPPEALPPGQEGFMPSKPAAGAPQLAWKAYDNSRRLEENRDRKSRQNHNQLTDMMGQLLESNTDLGRRVRESQKFMKEFKDAAIRSSHNRVTATPSAKPSPSIRSSLRD